MAGALHSTWSKTKLAALRRKRIENKQCLYCGKPTHFPPEVSLYCIRHGEISKEEKAKLALIRAIFYKETIRARFERKRLKGECNNCKKKVKPGYRLCLDHLEYLENYRKAHPRRKKRKRKTVWEKEWGRNIRTLERASRKESESLGEISKSVCDKASKG